MTFEGSKVRSSWTVGELTWVRCPSWGLLRRWASTLMTHHFCIDSRAAACNANSCWSIRGDLSEPALDFRVSLDCLSRSSTSHRRKRECVLQSGSIDPIESSTFLPQLLWLKRLQAPFLGSSFRDSVVCAARQQLLITESRRSGFTDGHFCLCCRSLWLLWAAEAEVQTPGGQHLPRGPQSKYLQTHYMFVVSPIGHLI